VTASLRLDVGAPGRIDGAGLAAYALPAVALMMTALPLNILLPDFYAERTALTLGAIGWLMLATRLIDAVADPLLGTWIDAQKLGGSYLRPLLIGAPLLALGFALLFHPPAGALAAPAAGLWLFATYTCACLGYSLATVAYQAWGAELADDDHGRARITGAREGAGLAGVLVGGSLPQVAGHSALVGLFIVVLAAALAWLAWRAPRPPAARLLRSVTPTAGVDPQPDTNPYTAFLVPLRHAATRWLLLVFALNALAPAITATVFVFFVTDRLQLGDRAAVFLALYFAAGAASMPLWVRLARGTSLHALWLAGMVAAVLSFVGTYWLAPGDFGAFAAICVLSGAAFGADLALPPALLARVIDANGHGGRREGAYFGLWNFVNKLVLALAGGIALNALQGLGYTRGATDAAALDALAFAYAALPCALKLAAAAMLLVAWRRGRF
jgi:Na+/melibiose symporter-like transporter